jgi:hypothetical protein
MVKMTFNERKWRATLQDYLKEFRAVQERDQKLPLIAAGKDGSAPFPVPENRPVDAIIEALTITLPRSTKVLSHGIEKIRRSYALELGKIVQDWSDEALMEVAKSFSYSVYTKDELFKALKEWQHAYVCTLNEEALH